MVEQVHRIGLSDRNGKGNCCQSRARCDAGPAKLPLLTEWPSEYQQVTYKQNNQISKGIYVACKLLR